ncbi:MAG TPA: class I SAM-dependent methyltransferase [Thermoanaerobaculia bacterium]|nr:class I SAM-dependent methyltransferase [Thermoanaerobaculia bacterium]
MEKNIDFGTVADLYDLYVAWGVDVPFFQDLCAGTEGEVLELMCGTGRLSLPLLRAGVRLCCVDYSREMLDVLRRKLREEGLAADVREADVRELDLGRAFELILLPFHSFSEVLDPAGRARALSRIHAHLAPGGRFVVSLHNPAVQVPRLDGERRKICARPIPGRAATLRVWSTARYRAGESLGEALQEYEILDAAGRTLETRQLQLRFSVTGREAFEKEAADAGFQVLSLWGDYQGGPFDAECSPYMIWELTSSPTGDAPLPYI